MSITIELSPEQEAQVQERLGGTAEAQRLLFQYLEELLRQHSDPALKTRTPGLGRGCIVHISDDFDDPLPDSYWLGDAE